jgi:peroxiredoxin
MPIAQGDPAPEFVLPADDGTQKSLADLAGPDKRAILLAFFKTGCPTCNMAFPVYAELERRYGDAVPVVAVSQDSLGRTVPWLRGHGFAGLALDDESDRYQVSAAYHVQTVPSLVLVEDGQVAASSEAWDREQVNAWARLLGEVTGRTTDPVSSPNDGRPAFKPG